MICVSHSPSPQRIARLTSRWSRREIGPLVRFAHGQSFPVGSNLRPTGLSSRRFQTDHFHVATRALLSFLNTFLLPFQLQRLSHIRSGQAVRRCAEWPLSYHGLSPPLPDGYNVESANEILHSGEGAHSICLVLVNAVDHRGKFRQRFADVHAVG